MEDMESKPSYEELMQAHMRLLEDFNNLQFQYQLLQTDKTIDRFKLLIDISKNKTYFTDKINKLVDSNLVQMLKIPKKHE